MSKYHADRYEARFKALIEAEFGPGASMETPGVRERFITNPKETDPILPASLKHLTNERHQNLQRLRGAS